MVRDYGNYRDIEDLLSYFRNDARFLGMNRGMLNKKFPGLYGALSRKGLLDNAIPADPVYVESGKVPKISIDERYSIVWGFWALDKNPFVVGEIFGRHSETVKKTWKKYGLTRGKWLPQKEERKIDRAYEDYDGNAFRAAKALNHATTTVLKYWRAAGKKIHHQGIRG